MKRVMEGAATHRGTQHTAKAESATGGSREALTPGGAAGFAAGTSAAPLEPAGWVTGELVLASGLGAAASPLSSLRGVSVFAGGAASVFVVLGSVSGDSGDSVFVDGVEAAGLGAKNPRSDSWPAAGLAIVFFGADMLPLARRGLASAGKCMGGTGGRRFP